MIEKTKKDPIRHLTMRKYLRKFQKDKELFITHKLE